MSLTLNENGAVSFSSTFSPLVDLFGIGGSQLEWEKITLSEFKKIVETCENAYAVNPTIYLNLLKYRRSIPHLGQKMMYYVMLTVVRMSNPEQYRSILEWSYACKKDWFRLARIYRMADFIFPNPATVDLTDIYQAFLRNPSKVEPATRKWLLSEHSSVVPVELELVVDELYREYREYREYQKEKEKDSKGGNLLFKFIGTEHFSVENNLIRRLLNQRLTYKVTNAELRRFYSHEKQKLHLFDTFLRGQKEDGSPLQNGDEEYVVGWMKKMSTLAFQHAKNVISKFAESKVPYQRVLYKAYDMIREDIRSKSFCVKSTGWNPVKECYDYFTKNTIDDELESALTTKFNAIKEKISTIKMQNPPIDIVIDNSGSMGGTPIQTALYISLILTRLFSLDRVTIFNSTAKTVFLNLNNDEKNEKWYDRIRSFYCQPTGSTNLDQIFPHLVNNSNTTLILTDGDCDPTRDGQNPFQTALQRFPNRKFVVWNLKDTKLNFPYCVHDSRVGYLSGNEPSVIIAVIRLLASGKELTPMNMLEECLNEDSLKWKQPKPDSNLNRMSDEQCSRLYKSIRHNISMSM